MKSMLAVLTITFCAGLSHAVELSRATNQELLNEVSSRLGAGGGGGGSLIAFCAGSDLNIEVDGTDSSDRETQYIANGGCAGQLKKVSGKLGSFSGARVIAICAGSDLVKYKATSTGSLSSTTNYIPNGQCQSQADLINSTL